jgi:hypothetical protein
MKGHNVFSANRSSDRRRDKTIALLPTPTTLPSQPRRTRRSKRSKHSHQLVPPQNNIRPSQNNLRPFSLHRRSNFQRAEFGRKINKIRNFYGYDRQSAVELVVKNRERRTVIAKNISENLVADPPKEKTTISIPTPKIANRLSTIAFIEALPSNPVRQRVLQTMKKGADTDHFFDITYLTASGTGCQNVKVARRKHLGIGSSGETNLGAVGWEPDFIITRSADSYALLIEIVTSGSNVNNDLRELLDAQVNKLIEIEKSLPKKVTITDTNDETSDTDDVTDGDVIVSQTNPSAKRVQRFCYCGRKTIHVPVRNQRATRFNNEPDETYVTLCSRTRRNIENCAV